MSKLCITEDNYCPNKYDVSAFMTVLNFLIKRGHTVFGGVVRDIIVPLSEVKNGNISVMTFEKALRKGSLFLNDIDVLFVGTVEEFNQMLSGILADAKKWDWTYRREDKDYLENGENGENGENAAYKNANMDVKKYVFRIGVLGCSVSVDFVHLRSRDNAPIDFNVNMLTWNKKDCFGLVRGKDSIHKKNFFVSSEASYHLSILDTVEDINARKCRALNRFVKKMGYKTEVVLSRIRKILSKGYSISNCSMVLYKSYEEFDPEDRKCLMCFDDLEEGKESISLCGNAHLFHESCGETWFKEHKKLECPLCKKLCFEDSS